MSAVATPPAPVGQPSSEIAELKTSPELELLLSCARRTLTVDRVGQGLQLLRQPLDWSLLIELADVHGLFPLLYWHVTRTLARDFPPQIAQQLDQRFRGDVARSLLLIRDLAIIVDLLETHGVQVIPFKGPALAESLYGNAALRECVDLDILLRSRDVPEAIRILVSAGYDAPKKLATAQQNAFVATQYEYPLLTPTGTLVELQWRIVPRYFSLPLPEEQYWRRIHSRRFGGREMNSLSCEDLLLLLCFHGSKHGWGKLIWLADVAELVTSNPQLDWQYVVDHARRAGGLRMLLLGVVLANLLLGTTIPNDLPQDRMVGQIASGICRNLVTEERPTYVKSQLYLLRVRERWLDRLRYIVRFTFTATPMEWEIVDLPPPLSFLYRFLRVLRGTVKGLSLAADAIFSLVRVRI